MKGGKLPKIQPPQPEPKGKQSSEKKKEVPHNPQKKKEVPHCPDKKNEVSHDPKKEKEVAHCPDKKKEVPHNPEKKKGVPHNPQKEKQVPHNFPDKKKEVSDCPDRKKEAPHCPEKKKEVSDRPDKKKEVPNSPDKKKEVPHSPDKKKEVLVPKAKEPSQKLEVKVKVQIPHKFEIIVQNADSTIDKSSTDKMYDQLYSGVFLNQKRKKFWVDKNSGSNSFMLFARDMSISWSEDSRYWKWIPVKETSDVIVDTAELLDVCWLEIKARIDTTKLSTGISYEVAFVLMMKDHAYGWENPLNLGLLFPDGCKIEHKKDLREIKQRNKWTEIRVGEFVASTENEGEMEISMYEYESGNWKRGIVIKGVVIRPKN